MAEIKIQEKKSSIWPWIIALLVIAAVVYFVIYYMDQNADADDGVFHLKETYNYTLAYLSELKGGLYV